MQLPETGMGRGDAAGLAITLIRTFGSGVLPLVEEQMTANADNPGPRARWGEIREALVALGAASNHMEIALGLLDQIEETSVPPMLDHAIEQLGFRGSERRTDGGGETIATCGVRYYGTKAQRHLDQAQHCADATEKVKHLDAASRYATLSEQIAGPIRPGL